ncbi:hypothetical protein [Nocardioides sp. SR21]|uniref:hypothetical protein n=1 Tax=Nocardioides sp. SR21 TaxID=2919501 RepID=UPI001FAB01F4|nr:hypothetical protein [Nocardioides sp. SR21]
MNSPTSSPRRIVALLAATALAVAGLAVSAGTLGDHSRTGTYAATSDMWAQCDEIIVSSDPGVPDGCAHADEPPMGVDLDKYVPTSVLETRAGAAPGAAAAAEDEGIPVPAQVAAASDEVECDGDGASGFRVQAMYVVTADKPNRYTDVADDIQQWAAGVDTVFNLSAAKTGGVRNVRYVTDDNGDGTCSAKVLNVTVPAGSFKTFDSSINALKALGYSNPARKYLMWVDGSGFNICGIALTYPYSTAGQSNPNNGLYPQYARTDAPCWGQGGTATSHSVEAHELAHTMGSVFSDAPHGTNAGHCYDESDTMCYADGGGKAMQQICAADQESLLDCNDDDYYSTYPPAGSWLATHWNAADSQFLIGGGNGSGGGTSGVPTKLGGTMTVNNPAVAGLPTQVALNLEVPAGRTTTIAWTSKRRDCVFADPTAVQTTVTCDAKTLSASTVTATVTDSTGEKLVRTIPITFSLTARTVAPTFKIDGAADAAYVTCVGGKGVLSAKVVDQTTGVGVKGIGVTFRKQTATATKPASAGTATTDVNGVATSKPVAMVAAKYSVATTLTKAVPSVASSEIVVTIPAGACATAVTAEVDDDTTNAGDPVTVTGTLTRTPPGADEATAAGEKVTFWYQYPGSTKWVTAGSTTTLADGTYKAVIKPLGTATLQARYAGKTGVVTASASEDVSLTVTPRGTELTSAISASTFTVGTALTVTGKLTQAVGADMVPFKSSRITITYPLAGGKTGTVNVTTNATGDYKGTIKPAASGTVTIKYVPKLGYAEAVQTKAVTLQ